MPKSALERLADLKKKEEDLLLEARGEMESEHRELTRQLRDLGKKYHDFTGESLQKVVDGRSELKPVAAGFVFSKSKAVGGKKSGVADQLIKHMLDNSLTQISVADVAKFMQTNKLSSAGDLGSAASALMHRDRRFERIERGVYFIKNRAVVAASMAGAEALNGGIGTDGGSVETDHGNLSIGS